MSSGSARASHAKTSLVWRLIGSAITVSIAAMIFPSRLSSAGAEDVLVIGDSQSYTPFGTRLRNALVGESGYEVSYYSRPGSVGQNWLDGTTSKPDYPGWNAPWGGKDERIENGPPAPKFEGLLRKHSPSLVVFQLGGNMVYQTESEIRSSIRQLIDMTKAAGSSCLWLGPPPGMNRPADKFAAFYKIARPTVEELGCRFLDTRDAVSTLQSGDGIHLHEKDEEGKTQIRNWLNQVVPVIQGYFTQSVDRPKRSKSSVAPVDCSPTVSPLGNDQILRIMRPFEIPK